MPISQHDRRTQISALLPQVIRDPVVIKLVTELMLLTEQAQESLTVGDYPIGGGSDRECAAVEGRHGGRVELAEEIEDAIVEALKSGVRTVRPQQGGDHG